MTLTEFLLARIAEDEERAKADRDEREWDGRTRTFYSSPGATRDDWGCYTFNVPIERVLAECEAKRQIVEIAFDHMETIDGEWGCCHSAAKIRAGECARTAPGDDELLQALALPYAAHPDFDEAWRP